MAKGTAIPTRFDSDQQEMLKWISTKSGLAESEIIRRAVLLLNSEVKRRHGRVAWIVEELVPDAHALGPMPDVPQLYFEPETLRAAEDPPPNPKEAQARRASGR